MYLQINTHSRYIVHYHSLKHNIFQVFLLDNNDVFEIIYSGNLAIFDETKWIASIPINYFNKHDTYQLEKLCLKKCQLHKIKKPIDVLNIISNKENKIYVYHVAYQVLFEEYISENIYIALDILYRKITSTYLHQSIINSFIKYISKLLGYYYDSNSSKKHIYTFIREYNIDTSILPANENLRWTCFNDFFSRNIDMAYRPIQILEDTSIICPADSRVICFDSCKLMKNYIKNPKFNFNKIIGHASNLKSGIICRLAPQDYHHFHSPMMGEIYSITVLGSMLHSVNPIGMQSTSVNILNDNMRVILHIKNKDGLECYYVIVGASLVGSVRFFSSKLQQIYQCMIRNKHVHYQFMVAIPVSFGQDLGTFLYGGSTIVMIWNKQIKFRKEIVQYSLYRHTKQTEPIESYCQVRSYLGFHK